MPTDLSKAGAKVLCLYTPLAVYVMGVIKIKDIGSTFVKVHYCTSIYNSLVCTPVTLNPIALCATGACFTA